LIAGFAWPQLLYRYIWGPDAPSPVRRLFDGISQRSGRLLSPVELREAGLLADFGETGVGAASADEVETLMNSAHCAGIVGLRTAFERAARMPGAQVRFAAMPGVRRLATSSARFLAERDADRRAFNRRFHHRLLTEADARATLQRLKAGVPPGYRDYAPIDFGRGLAIGQIASTDSGTGRWEFFNGDIVGPLVKGKRVLDLGSNNGSMPLMMLREGAAEVVAIEFTAQIAEFARFNAQVLSWRDMRPYKIDVLDADMRLFLTQDLGRFDVITAFCSLYYLPRADMARIIRTAAAMGATIVLQANEAIDNLPAQARDLESLLHQNGYGSVKVYAPAGFSRPLLVGKSPVVAATIEESLAARA
jgi:SAM-dependent methyltransferase